MLDSYLFRVFIIPSAVFLSVVFGGSYGTGREVMEFISRHGPVGGLIAIAAVVITYCVLLFATFELGRKFQQFEYRGFFQRLLGRFWFLYEVVILIGMVITLAVCTTASGAIAESRFSLPTWVGSGALLLIVFVLTYQGRALVEKTMIMAVLALAAILVALLFQLAGEPARQISHAFASEPVVWDAWQGGAQYALVNGGFIPLLLYCARGVQTRGQAGLAAVCAASVAVLPGLVFHYAFMSAYPAITEEQLPAYQLMSTVGSPLFLNIYIVVLFVLIAQTGVGMLQGFLERIDSWHLQRFERPLNHLGHGLVAVGMVCASMTLGSMGIIALIIAGYSILAASFILVFAVPLLTRGLWLIFRQD
ncbi:MAG: hypothetical protein OEV47_00270 [Gammaproteobacteria bacterium]|jgi:uncharacterized membrane protein YkvI|nr:hypothetical protein [Gammaproteobacteria bacterium]